MRATRPGRSRGPRRHTRQEPARDAPPPGRRSRSIALLAGLGALGAGLVLVLARDPWGGETPARVRLTITAPAGAGIDLEHARIAGGVEPTVLLAERPAPGQLDLHLALPRSASAGPLELRAPGACPATVALPGPGERVDVTLEPIVSFETPEERAALGYGVPFSIDLRTPCPEALKGPVTWRQVGGEPLAELAIEEGGMRVRGRTPAFPIPSSDRPAWGIVPISPRTRGAFALEATLPTVDGPRTRRLELAAAPRASGLPTLSVGQRVLLAGDGWRIQGDEAQGPASLEPGPSGLTAFEASRAGRWTLVDAESRELRLSAGRHDEMPLDCGRSGCHGGAAEHARTSPMTTVLARGLEGALGNDYDPRCALACHATGEPGLPGGFTDVLASFPGALPAGPHPGAHAELPRALRRLGGVGCTACHGPAQIPEPSARWSVLRSDVCATCHDAPPRYGHVEAWRGSKMARADASPASGEGACARCHTTAGFLDAIGVRPLTEGAAPPAHVGPVGIACAACHAPHGPHEGPLLRRVAFPASLAPSGALPATAAPSAICLPCHAPAAPEPGRSALPAASAAALWLGQGGLAADGAELRSPSPAPHAGVPGGCVGCHASGPEGLERGASHGFRARGRACKPCHEAPPVEAPGPGGERIAARAARLQRELVKRGALRQVEGAPPGAPHAFFELAAPEGSPLARAAHDVWLVLEDPAAAIHNAPYARALLDAAERLLAPDDSDPHP